MNCPLCEGRAVFWRHHQRTPILRCTERKCGFRFFELSKWTAPTSHDYYAGWQPSEFMSPYPWIRARVEMVKRLKPNGALAELGCGIGETAIAFEGAGYQVTGVEESEKAIAFLRHTHSSIDWQNADILDFLTDKRAAFDIITMYHVLEHIPKPNRMIEKIDAALRPNGLIVVEVPDVGGGWARLQGSKWEYYLDHHVNYFDVTSLCSLFSRHGYRMTDLQRTYQFSYPQGETIKDFVKGALGKIGLNSIIRTAWIAAEK